MKKVLVFSSLIFSFGLSAEQQLQEKEMNNAFECSIYAAIASQSAETPNVRREWRSESIKWLELAYTKGATDEDYQEVPEIILQQYEDLENKDIYYLSASAYQENGCQQPLESAV